MKKIFLIMGLLILISAGAYAVYIYKYKENAVTLTGKENLIRVNNPQPNQIINSPLVVIGEARGTWYFEAVFPVFLTDWDGKIIAQGQAQAQSDWMTDNFVPFKATLEFKRPADIKGVLNRGALILKKDNPSGLPEKDDALEIQILF